MDNNLQPAPKNTGSDEIDLGQLFNLIGDGFRNLFNFFGSVLQKIFEVVLFILIFLQKHFLKIALVIVTGLVLGFLADSYVKTKYISTMVVEPNFNSAQQLYNNISFYNELAIAQDSVSLSEALEISVHEAASLKSFKIESYADENQKVKLFDTFVRELDSTTRNTIDLANFMENFNSFDARFHNISVVATDPFVARETQPAILNSIVRNDYFSLQKDIAGRNFDVQDSIIKIQLAEIDSLQSLYKRVMEKEAAKPMQGTNISLGESGDKESKELALISQIDQLKDGLVELNQERANKSEIINVISEFPKRGVVLKGFLNSYKLLFPVALVVLTLLVLLMIEINRFLNAYKKKRNL